MSARATICAASMSGSWRGRLFRAVSNAALTYDFVADAPLDWAALEAQGAARTQRLFKRDCLMVETEHDGAPLTLFVCHFKSMQPASAGGDGRADTQAVRAAEVWAVRRLIERRFGQDVARANWAICGDFNDFLVAEGVAARHSALAPLFIDGFCVNVVERLAPQERWTHYYTGGDAYVQLDYICLSPALAAANPDALPEIERAADARAASRRRAALSAHRLGSAESQRPLPRDAGARHCRAHETFLSIQSHVVYGHVGNWRRFFRCNGSASGCGRSIRAIRQSYWLWRAARRGVRAGVDRRLRRGAGGARRVGALRRRVIGLCRRAGNGCGGVAGGGGGQDGQSARALLLRPGDGRCRARDFRARRRAGLLQGAGAGCRPCDHAQSFRAGAVGRTRSARSFRSARGADRFAPAGAGPRARDFAGHGRDAGGVPRHGGLRRAGALSAADAESRRLLPRRGRRDGGAVPRICCVGATRARRCPSRVRRSPACCGGPSRMAGGELALIAAQDEFVAPSRLLQAEPL